MALHSRTITDPEFAGWLNVATTAFFSEVPTAETIAFRRSTTDLDRTWGTFDGDEVVATLRTFPGEITVPGGGILAADMVTSVTTRSTHRRQGALTAMMTRSLDAAVDRGDPVSILIAARWPIYGRYGFGPATEMTSLAIDPRTARFPGTAAGGLRYVDAASVRDEAEAVFDRFRQLTVGGITRRPRVFDHDFAVVETPGEEQWKGYCVLHHGPDGQADGYLRYHVIDTWHGMEPDSTLVVDDLISTTPESYAALWRLCLDTDNITSVTAEWRRVDEPLRWLVSDGRAVQRKDRSDFLWLRLLDVPVSLAARRYLTEGSLVIEVTDPMGHANGRYALDGGPDGATCVRTEASPDVTITSTAMGAAFLGASRLRELASTDQVVEQTPGALARADAMFLPEVAPWCNTMF